MKAIIRRMFVPSYYSRELYQKLQMLNRGFKIIDDYFKEMKVTIIRSNMEEDREATMAQIPSGLNQEIANIVYLHHYIDLEYMVHTAIKMERQLQMRGNHVLPQKPNFSTHWKSNWRKEEGASYKPKSNPFKAKKAEISRDKVKTKTSSHIHKIKYFLYLGRGNIVSQSPNKRIMVTQTNGEVKSESESEDEEIPPLEAYAIDERNWG